ncbi:septum formation initiator family protein [Patescibacteria group bacterium]|nr:septum formation initiator family protein [Patescibacteria group bacterium]MBU3922806.1 septum formation initiator family protein [Patescibacteria group bacterium]
MKLLHSKYFVIFLFVIFVFVFVAFGKESYRFFKVNQEIKDLEKRIEDLKKENQELANMEKYFESNDFLEKEARLKLNLTKPGEKLIIIKDIEEVEQEIVEEKISNIQKWFNYFFEEK